MNDNMKRCAGILTHITSLPGPFGMGDLGQSSRLFADLLHRTRQSIWQLLPLTPIDKASFYSPYSSCSSMAGNSLLISPESLLLSGWLRRKDIEPYLLPQGTRVDFSTVEKNKNELLALAFQNFKKKKKQSVSDDFRKFRQRENYWLRDFALFMTLRDVHQFKPWFQWPAPFRKRDAKALRQFEADHANDIELIFWKQFIFERQWMSLKKYCHQRGVRLMGDLPFYVSHDSCDVWAHPEIFSIDRDGNMKEVAGVPPDYFNAQGQLWGMPVFRWDILKKQRYDWWLKRVRKNMEWTDIIRLDHFRAFSAYWSVPAGQKTAVRGKWKKGPGEPLFLRLRSVLGELPFVAEDLGDIDESVHALRNAFSFPGMKVLQFAFGDKMASSIYIPHNYTKNFAVYTGTHDNNTTRGWFRKDANAEEKKNLSHYLSRSITDRNIHREMIGLAFGSVAVQAIIPLQDILGLDEKSRMNTPASITNNWQWRCTQTQLDSIDEGWLTDITTKFNRSSY
jgi:4-alpha-glucanotransferase